VGPEQGLAEARQALPEAAFAAAWDAGRQLTLAQAVELVLASFALLATKAETSAPGEHADAFTLTPREREILRFLCEGCSDREIAAALHISPRTVGGHVTNLLAKLGVESRTAAAAFAVRRGLC
jgi:DNA-binding NarL/FixJ family response regulator